MLPNAGYIPTWPSITPLELSPILTTRRSAAPAAEGRDDRLSHPSWIPPVGSYEGFSEPRFRRSKAFPAHLVAQSRIQTFETHPMDLQSNGGKPVTSDSVCPHDNVRAYYPQTAGDSQTPKGSEHSRSQIAHASCRTCLSSAPPAAGSTTTHVTPEHDRPVDGGLASPVTRRLAHRMDRVPRPWIRNPVENRPDRATQVRSRSPGRGRRADHGAGTDRGRVVGMVGDRRM